MPGEQLRITGGPAAGSQLDIGQELQIGRSAGGEGRLGDDPEISRQHARLSRNPQGQLVVEDLGSTNGTYVNGQRIAGPTTLNPGDTVQMGRSTLSVEGAAGGQATAIGAVPVGAGPPPPPPAAPPPAGPPTQPLPPTGQQPAFAQGPPGGPPPPGYGPGGPGGPGGGRNNSRIALIAGLIAAVVILAVVLALALSGGDDDKKSSSAAAASTPTSFTMDTSSVSTTTESTETTTEETTTDDTGSSGGGGLEDIPPNVKKQFVTGCEKGGGSKTACQCAIDEIDKKYDFVEFLDIINKVNDTGKFPPKVQKIIQSCA
jgi:hypothetical protein